MKRILNWLRAHQLFVFFIGTMIISIIMVSIGMSVYHRSGAYRFDLSRPGYEHIRAEVDNEGIDLTHFPRSGAIDQEAIQDFRNRYNRIVDRLNKMNNYDPEIMSNENLGLPIEMYRGFDEESEDDQW